MTEGQRPNDRKREQTHKLIREDDPCGKRLLEDEVTRLLRKKGVLRNGKDTARFLMRTTTGMENSNALFSNLNSLLFKTNCFRDP